MPDAEAVERLVSHRYFRPHVTPVQVLNRATDPFLPSVRPHTLAVLADLDGRGLRNHVLVITRHQMKPGDIGRLNQLVNLKVTLLFTYSGIDDTRIEPYPSARRRRLADSYERPGRRRYRTILYWRPLVPGLNDTAGHLARACALSCRCADATVFTGLFFRDEIAEYYRASGLPEPYEARRAARSCPRHSNSASWPLSPGQPRCSARPVALSPTPMACPTTTATYGIRELCDICPAAQLSRCRGAHRVPSARQVKQAASALPEAQRCRSWSITERAAIVSGLADEQPRYFLQHALGFQVHDVRHPHHAAPSRPRRDRMEGRPGR